MAHNLARHKSALTSLRHGLRSLNKLHTTTDPANLPGNMNVGGIPQSRQQSPTSTPPRRQTPWHNPTPLLSNRWWHSSCPILRFVTAQARHQRPLPTTPLFCLRLNTTYLTSHFNLLLKKLPLLFMNQRFANLPGILSRLTNQLCRQLWSYHDLQGERFHRPRHLRCSSLLQYLLDYAVKAFSKVFPLVPNKKLKTEGKRAAPFENLNQPPDDVNHDKSTKFIVTNVVVAVITSPIKPISWGEIYLSRTTSKS